MKIFFDTEFTGLSKETTLISIGVVNENSSTFYAELTDYDPSQVDGWIEENVIRNLRFRDRGDFVNQAKPHAWEAKGDKKKIAHALGQWVRTTGGMGEKVEIWSDVLAFDWVLFCDLFGGAFSIPEKVFYIPFDLATLLKVAGVNPDIGREEFAEMKAGEDQKHNALWDAKVIKACHDKAMTLLGR